MAFTLEMVNEEKYDEFVELRKGETDIYKNLALWKGDVVSLKRTSGAEALVLILGYDEEVGYMNGLELVPVKSEGKYIDEAVIQLKDSTDEETYYVNCMQFICCKNTCINDLYGTVKLRCLETIISDVTVSFGLKAACLEAPGMIHTRIFDKDNKKKDPKKDGDNYKGALTIFSSSLKKQNAELKKEVTVLRGRLENLDSYKAVGQNKAEIKELEGKVNLLTSEITGKDSRINKLTEEKRDLESKISGLNQAIENKNRELSSSKAVGKSQRHALDEKNFEVKKLKSDKEDLIKKNKNLSDLVDELKKEKIDLTKSVDNLTVSHNDNAILSAVLENRLEEAKKNSEKLENNLNEVRKENERMKKDLENLSAENKNLKANDAAKVPLEETSTVTASVADIDMRVHDLELELSIYKKLYGNMMNRLISK